MNRPRFASSLSTSDDPQSAVEEGLDGLLEAWTGPAPDLVVAFATADVSGGAKTALGSSLGAHLAARTGAREVLGCTGSGVLGTGGNVGRAGVGQEVERGSGLSLWAARLPGTELRSFRVVVERTGDGHLRLHGGPPVVDPSRAGLLLLGDPGSFPAEPFLERVGQDFPGVPTVGGLASGAEYPGADLLFTQDFETDSGAVGLVLEGDVELLPIVSQGCRPVGSPWVITAAERNHLQKLGGRPALDVLIETLEALEADERNLFQSAPHIGLALDARKSAFGRSDFLVRGLMGVDPEKKSVAIGALPRRGQTVQFLVRDGESAGPDLERRVGALTDPEDEYGALMFTCNGRGQSFHGQAHQDVERLAAGLGGPVPLGGLFAAGEIGPVGSQNFIHAFTASIALFRSRFPQD
jgi:small ligand-binding sensory domain FIST